MYICTRITVIVKRFIGAISSAGSEHLVYTEGVGGSNPSSPTKNFNRNVGVFFMSCFYWGYRLWIKGSRHYFTYLLMIYLLTGFKAFPVSGCKPWVLKNSGFPFTLQYQYKGFSFLKNVVVSETSNLINLL